MLLFVEVVFKAPKHFFLSDDNRAQGSELAPWPSRLTSPPPRLADLGYSSEIFEKDTVTQTCELILLLLFKSIFFPLLNTYLRSF
jgi:hypothetical protein